MPPGPAGRGFMVSSAQSRAQNVRISRMLLHMAKIFTGLLKNVGYEEQLNENDLVKLKRLDAVKWACIVGNLKCRKNVTLKLDKYLVNPARKQLLFTITIIF